MTLAIDLRATRNALNEWLRTASGIECVWGNQNASQPAWPFARMKLLSSAPVSNRPIRDYRIEGVEPNCTMFEDVLQERRLIFNVQTLVGPPDDNNFDKDAHQLLHNADCALGLTSVRTRFKAANVSIETREPIVDLESLVDAKWISRASMDLTMRAVCCISETIDFFDSAFVEGEVTGTMDDPKTIPEFEINFGA